MSLPLAFAGYSNKALVSVLGKRTGISFNDAKAAARTVRALWFMRQIGTEWVSIMDLQKLGAGQWNNLKWSVPDGVRKGWIDQVPRNNGFIYRINATGVKIIEEADRYVQEEYERSLKKCTAYRMKHQIKRYTAANTYTWRDLIAPLPSIPA